jgi:chaperone modulatory protein CbpM
MTMRVESVIALVPGVAPAELADWVARGWVRPEGEPPDWAFAEIDVARVRLIRTLRTDLEVEPDTLPLVLNLVDQVYDLRRRLSAVLGAACGQPEPVREAILRALRELS